MVRYPDTSNNGKLSLLSLGELRSIVEDGEFQAGAGVTKETALLVKPHWAEKGV